MYSNYTSTYVATMMAKNLLKTPLQSNLIGQEEQYTIGEVSKELTIALKKDVRRC